MLDPEVFENLQNERDDFRAEVESLTSSMETMKADCAEANERITFYKDKYENETAEVLRLLTRISTLETITVTLDSIDSLPPTNPDQYYAFYNDITLGELGTAIEKDQTAMDSNCPPDIIPSEADKFRPPQQEQMHRFETICCRQTFYLQMFTLRLEKWKLSMQPRELML